MTMILLNPPVLRNCEPPVALAHLGGALKEAGENVILIDGAYEALAFMIENSTYTGSDARIQRAWKNSERVIETLRSPRGYSSLDRYKKAVHNYGLVLSSCIEDAYISPADYKDDTLSPLKREDLIYAAEHPIKNPFYPWFSKRLNQVLNNSDELYIGISMGYLSQALPTMAMLGYIKQNFPHIKVQLGGSLVGSWFRNDLDLTFLNPYCAEIQPGAGEKAIVAFVGREYKGMGRPFWDNLFDNSYISPVKILPYAASTGCSWKRCTFCSECWEDQEFKELAPSEAISQIQSLVDEHKPGLLHITDSEMSPQLMQKLMEQPIGIKWYGFSRFLPAMMNLEYCQKLADSGCTMLCLGLESGDQGVLNKIRKGILLSQVEVILENLKKVGIGTFIYLLFGTPSENEEAAEETKKFALNNAKAIGFMNLAVFTMPAQSGEAETVTTMPFYEGDLSLSINFEHPQGWSRQRVRKFIDKSFKKEKSLKEILLRTPPIYTSSHAPFFCLFDPSFWAEK